MSDNWRKLYFFCGTAALGCAAKGLNERIEMLAKG